MRARPRNLMHQHGMLEKAGIHGLTTPPLLPQSLANIAWAFATLGHLPAPPFLPLLGDAALRRLHAFEPLGLSLLVWSLASLGCGHAALLEG